MSCPHDHKKPDTLEMTHYDFISGFHQLELGWRYVHVFIPGVHHLNIGTNVCYTCANTLLEKKYWAFALTLGVQVWHCVSSWINTISLIEALVTWTGGHLTL